MKKIDLTGKRIGILTVVDQAESKTHSGKLHIYWNCICDCGVKKQIRSVSLTKTKHVQSCGCLGYYHPKRYKPDGEAALTGILNNYRQNARNRNLEFSLSKEQFTQLINQNCYYCGIVPSTIFTKKGSKGSITYNGIDRLDSRVGYNYTNCVACYPKCNWSKSDDSLEKFINWIKRTSSHLINKGLL